jgi:hypothetical protein
MFINKGGYMPKEYIVKAVKSQPKSWMSKHGEMYTWLIQVEGNGEPVQLNKKPSSTAPKVGDVIYGEIELSDFGQKLQQVQRPQPQAQQSYTPAAKKEWQPRDDDRIVAQWAIGNAITLLEPEIAKSKNAQATEDLIETWAKKLFAMVGRVKTGEQEVAKSELDSLAETAEDTSEEEFDLNSIPF